MIDVLRRAAAAVGLRAGRRGASAGGPAASAAKDTSAWNPSGWWWCLDHNRPENPPDSPGHRRLGPYENADAARAWRTRLDRRNEDWEEYDADDRRP
jgi:hypothetical protein